MGLNSYADHPRTKQGPETEDNVVIGKIINLYKKQMKDNITNNITEDSINSFIT